MTKPLSANKKKKVQFVIIMSKTLFEKKKTKLKYKYLSIFGKAYIVAIFKLCFLWILNVQPSVIQLLSVKPLHKLIESRVKEKKESNDRLIRKVFFLFFNPAILVNITKKIR